jgi:hypothetical protein
VTGKDARNYGVRNWFGGYLKKHERRTVSFISRISGRIALQNLSPVNAVTSDFSIRQYASRPLRKCIIWLLRELCSWSFLYVIPRSVNCPGYLSMQILTAILLELPISVVEGADLTGLEPPGDAVEMESMLAPRRQMIHYK